MRRITEHSVWPSVFVDSIIESDALSFLEHLPSECISLAITSPPYWDMVDYGNEGQIGQSSYPNYLDQLLAVWRETERVLIPNGKLAIVTPILPVPKSVNSERHTRKILNINNDIESKLLTEVPSLDRYSLFIWQKQTSVKMFGSYPYPPNIYEDNTIEFINVFVKDGRPPFLPAAAKTVSKLTQDEWVNLSMQIWPIYPEDVKRAGGHPAPFPIALPLRLIKMFSFAKCPEAGFEGDIVLDMFNGAGATSIAAKAAGRRFIGVDINSDYCSIARRRLATEHADNLEFMLARIPVRKPTNSRQLTLLPDGELRSEEGSPWESEFSPIPDPRYTE